MGGGPFVGTTGVDSDTLVRQQLDVIRELVRHGVRKLVLLVGHFENMFPSIEAANLAHREAVMLGVPDLKIVRLEYWDHVTRCGRWRGAHGATCLTMLAAVRRLPACSPTATPARSWSTQRCRRRR